MDGYFGIKVEDPYRWFENDSTEEVKNWVNQRYVELERDTQPWALDMWGRREIYDHLFKRSLFICGRLIVGRPYNNKFTDRLVKSSSPFLITKPPKPQNNSYDNSDVWVI